MIGGWRERGRERERGGERGRGREREGDEVMEKGRCEKKRRES